MKPLAFVFGVMLLCCAGCVNVDLGQASKDWSDVGKSFADKFGNQPDDSNPQQLPEPPEQP